jgi:hypothetical protein
MANFAIMRVEKVKTMSALSARGKHNFRERDTPNADSDRSELNTIEGAQSTAELLQAVSALLPTKRRKDAVIGLEYLITASPEHFGTDWRENKEFGEAYFRDAITWLEQRHGKQNVVCKTIHLDESTPHLAAFVVPRTADGRQSAKDFVGGAATLGKMQTSFAAEVGAKHGLVRGIERSKAVHQDAAKIQPMTVERMELRKQVKVLSDEVDRLTKVAAAGGAALLASEKALHRAQKALEHSRKLNLEFSKKIADLEAKEKAEARKEAEVATPLEMPLEASKEAQEAFELKWQGIEHIDAQRASAGRLMDVYGNRAVYHLGRGVHGIRTFAPGEKVPQLETQQEKAGVAR